MLFNIPIIAKQMETFEAKIWKAVKIFKGVEGLALLGGLIF